MASDELMAGKVESDAALLKKFLADQNQQLDQQLDQLLNQQLDQLLAKHKKDGGLTKW